MMQHTEPKERPDTAESKNEEILCKRLERSSPVAEHLDCPYCHGADKDVRTGEHKRFCDFQPGVDPIVFGFPPNLERYERG